jgi:hypothetical protein
MRFQLTSAWPASAAMIEPGTIIDGNSPEWLGKIMPFTVMCLDQEAANQMAIWYPHWELHKTAIRYAPGVKP